MFAISLHLKPWISRKGPDILRWVARSSLVISIVLVLLHFLSIHPPAVLLLWSALFAVAAFAVRPSWKLRIAVLVTLACAALLGAQQYARAVRLQRFVADMRPFTMQLKLIHRRIAAFYMANPQCIITNLDQLVSSGVLKPSDTNIFANASVTVYAYKPNGTSADVLMDIAHGAYRTLVSQNGDIFTYTPKTIEYLGTTETPSDRYLHAIEAYQGRKR